MLITLFGIPRGKPHISKNAYGGMFLAYCGFWAYKDESVVHKVQRLSNYYGSLLCKRCLKYSSHPIGCKKSKCVK